METHDKNEILFSRTVKAGKRVYYIDVKQDRRGGRYLSVTESKRVYNTPEQETPVFEKHKIFLYSEDFDKFSAAFQEAVDFVQKSLPEEAPASGDSEAEGLNEDSFRLDVSF